MREAHRWDEFRGSGAVRRRLGLVMGVLALQAGGSFAAFGEATFRADRRHSGVYDSAAVDRFETVEWVFQTGGAVRSSPAVTASTVFVGSGDHRLYAVDRENGDVRWSFRTAGPVHGSPAVADGVVYVTSMDRRLYAVDAANGEPRWSFSFGDDLPFEWGWDFWASSPVVVGGKIFVGGGDGYLHALDATTGTSLWRFRTGGRVRSSPAVVDGVVYAGSMDGYLYAVEATTGELVRRFAPEGAGLDSAKLGADYTSIQSSPAVVDGSVLFGGRDGHLYSVRAADGRESWRLDHDGSWVVSSPAVTGGLVYVGGSDGYCLQAVDFRSGRERWRFTTPHRVWSSPAIAGGVVVFGCQDGFLYALDRTSGQEQWRFRTDGMIHSSPVVADGRIYVGSDDGRLYALLGASTPDSGPPRRHRAVFWQEVRGWKWFQDDEEVRDYFSQEGYTVVDGAELAGFLGARIEDRSPSVVIFAVDRVPEEIGTDPAGEMLLRRYLESGGTVVWPGMPPLAAVIDPQTGERIGWNLEATEALLGVHHEKRSLREPLESRPTAEGRRWGLSGWWVSTGWVEPDAVTTVLATNESGQASSWVKIYGGGPGTGFIKLPGGPELPFDLGLVKAVAEAGAVGYLNPEAEIKTKDTPDSGARHIGVWVPVAERTELASLARLEKSPEVLAGRGATLIKQLGGGDRTTDRETSAGRVVGRAYRQSSSWVRKNYLQHLRRRSGGAIAGRRR